MLHSAGTATTSIELARNILHTFWPVLDLQISFDLYGGYRVLWSTGDDTITTPPASGNETGHQAGGTIVSLTHLAVVTVLPRLPGYPGF